MQSIILECGTSLLTEMKSISVEPNNVSVKELVQKHKRIGFFWDNGHITLYDDEYANRIPDKKGQTAGSIYLDDKVIDVLGPYGAIISAPYGTQYSTEIPKIVKAVQKILGIDRLSVRFSGGKSVKELPSLINKREITLFHGTSSEAYNDGHKPISKFGLVPGQGHAHWAGTGRSLVGARNAIYLTDDENQARNYAWKATDEEGGNPIVLRVHVSIDHLVPDDDWIHALVPSGRQGVTWQDSLKAIGQVGYTKRIPASKIDIAWQGKGQAITGKRKSIESYDEIRSYQKRIKDDLLQIEDGLRDAGVNHQWINKYPFDELISRIDHATSVKEVGTVANELYMRLGGDKGIDTWHHLEKLCSKLKSSMEEQTRELNLLQPALKILKSHGFDGKNPYDTYEAWRHADRDYDDEESNTKAGEARDALSNADMGSAWLNKHISNWSEADYNIKKFANAIRSEIYTKRLIGRDNMHYNDDDKDLDYIVKAFCPYVHIMAAWKHAIATTK